MSPAKKQSTDAAKYEYSTWQPGELELALEDIKGEQFAQHDLPLIHCGMGGDTHWHSKRGAETMEGPQEGVIIHVQTKRTYWPGKFEGGNEPPQCISDDGLVGVGDPGGECAFCPMNEYGTGEDGQDRKGCAERRMIYFLQDGCVIPLVVQVSPGSLQACKQYMLNMLNFGGVKRWTTILSVEKTRGKHGDYSQIAFARGDRLEEGIEQQIRAYSDMLMGVMTARQIVDEQS